MVRFFAIGTDNETFCTCRALYVKYYEFLLI